MTFTSLEQRMAQTYMDMFPKFVPDKNVKIDTAEQEQFYLLIKNLYKLAFNEPLLFVPSLHEDDAYPNRYNKKAYGKPELINNMRKFVKTIDSLLESMYLFGQDSKNNFNKKQQEILSKLGINNFNKLPKAWAWMSKRPKSSFVEFMYCLCIPNGLKVYLDAFDTMSEKNKSFVIKHTKKCDGCRYCVQTDKTGSRPMAFIQIIYEQKIFNLCPYFPGYCYSWTNINDDLVDQLIEMLFFMDKFIPKK
jgi:hypothetical protein